MRTLVIVLLFVSIFGFSCQYLGEGSNYTYPDTTVLIDKLTPQVCQVTIYQSDTTYTITDFWTDQLTGDIVYKMKESPYKFSRLHGIQYVYNDRGDTMEMDCFDRGIRVDSSYKKHPNGQIALKEYYSSKKDGNKIYAMRFHANGMKETDVIQYTNGVINDAVTFYDDSPENKITEIFYYVNDQIVGIRIFNEQYQSLDRRKDALYKAYRADSARIAMALMDTSVTEFVEIPVVYENLGSDANYDIGGPDPFDIMIEDPAFVLRLGKGVTK